jgi:hypothetical protein
VCGFQDPEGELNLANAFSNFTSANHNLTPLLLKRQLLVLTALDDREEEKM